MHPLHRSLPCDSKIVASFSCLFSLCPFFIFHLLLLTLVSSSFTFRYLHCLFILLTHTVSTNPPHTVPVLLHLWRSSRGMVWLLSKGPNLDVNVISPPPPFHWTLTFTSLSPPPFGNPFTLQFPLIFPYSSLFILSFALFPSTLN
jgi:hypothetical protein